MSSGRTHVKASLFLAAGFGVGMIVSPNPELIKCIAGSLVGILLTPDLDVDKTYIGNKIIKEKIGYIPERMWNGFWWGYKKSFKHGQFGSHFPIFSTFVRLSYVFFWLVFVPHFLIYFSANPNWNLTKVLLWYAKILFDFYFFCGLSGSDLVHYVLDKLTKNVD